MDIYVAQLATPDQNAASGEVIEAQLVLAESSIGNASRRIARFCLYGYIATILALTVVAGIEHLLFDGVAKGVLAVVGFGLLTCMAMNCLGTLLGVIGLCGAHHGKRRIVGAVAMNVFCPLALLLLAALVAWPRMYNSWSTARASHRRAATRFAAREEARLATIYQVRPDSCRRWRKALYRERRYDDVAAHIESHLDSPFDAVRSRELSYLYSTLSEAYDNIPLDLMQDVLDEWVARAPDSHIPRLVRGKFRIKHAWKIRGGGYVHTVAKDAWPKFHAKIAEAAVDLQRAHELGSHDPNAAASMIEVTMVESGYNRNRMEGWYAAAMLACPRHVEARENKMFFLTPKWGGSFEEMRDFATELRQEGEQYPELGWVVMGMWHELDRLNRQQKHGENIYADEEIWAEIEWTARRYLEHYPERIQMRYTLAYYAVKAGRHDVAFEQFEEIGDRWLESNTWRSLPKYNAARAAEMWSVAQRRFIKRDYDEAERLAQASVRLDPNSCTARLVLARILAEGRRDLPAARKQVQQAVPLAKTDEELQGLKIARQMLGV